MKIKNLGNIKECDIETNKLTVFFGENSSGKTYVSYMIYGIAKFIEETTVFEIIKEEEIDILKAQGEFLINGDKLIERYLESLYTTFLEDKVSIISKIYNISLEETKLIEVDIKKEEFKNLFWNGFHIKSLKSGILNINSFEIEYSNNLLKLTMLDRDNDIYKVDINELTKGINTFVKFFLKVWYSPAERIGINVFSKEIILDRASQTFIDKSDKNPSYPKAISDYFIFLIKIMRDRNSIYYRENEFSDKLSQNILKGKLEYNHSKDIFEYFMEENNNPIPIERTSSTIKSILGLDFYIKSINQNGNFMIIDELELNLDPQNQVKLIRLITELVDYGVKVIISTHSDYIVRELTNIVLENEIEKNDRIKDSDVNCYSFTKKEINKIPSLINAEYIENFDKTTGNIENKYYQLKDKYEELSKEDHKND